MAQKILVVEDDRMLVNAIVGELTEAGYEVDKARSGEEAEKKLNTQKFEMVFLDIMLKGEFNGFDVLKAIRGPESPYRQIPVVVLSNMGEIENMERARMAGATDYMVKATTDLAKIVEVARKYLHG